MTTRGATTGDAVEADEVRSSLASLPWYDLPEVQWANDVFWDVLAETMRDVGLAGVPARLNRQVHYEQQWTSPHFLFGQACGYDTHVARPQWLQVVATPHYAAAGCQAASYRSFVLVRADAVCRQLEDLRGARCVINTPTSHSGMNVLRSLVAPLHAGGSFFSKVEVSGSHEQSVRMILRGAVDVAAIDCITHALLRRHRPGELTGTRVLMQTGRVPAPPYVTGKSTSGRTLTLLRRALRRALSDPRLDEAKAALLLTRVEVLPGKAYHPIRHLAATARDHEYHEIPGR